LKDNASRAGCGGDAYGLGRSRQKT
jgi:hypothetical protein